MPPLSPCGDGSAEGDIGHRALLSYLSAPDVVSPQETSPSYKGHREE
jgi:hypothetical protein